MKFEYKYILIVIWIAIIFSIFAPMISAEEQFLGNFRQNDCINLLQTCSNCSSVNITKIVYPNSSVAISNVAMTKDGTSYSYNYCNTTLTGSYFVSGVGDLDGSSTVWTYTFLITPNGEEATVGKAVFYIGLLLVLLFFLSLSIYAFIEFNNLLSRVGMLGISYLLLIAIIFIGWNMAKDFITSSPFLIGMLEILFYVLIIGVFPLLIGAFAWYFIMLFRINEIQRLMDKGMSSEEAQKRQGRKYK